MLKFETKNYALNFLQATEDVHQMITIEKQIKEALDSRRFAKLL